MTVLLIVLGIYFAVNIFVSGFLTGFAIYEDVMTHFTIFCIAVAFIFLGIPLMIFSAIDDYRTAKRIKNTQK
jgi:ABC-type uncharacterized transport system permease subunit